MAQRPRTDFLVVAADGVPDIWRLVETMGSREIGKNGWSEKRGDGHMSHFVGDDRGQGLVEYALIIAVIAIAVIVAMLFLRDQLTNIFSNIGNNLT